MHDVSQHPPLEIGPPIHRTLTRESDCVMYCRSCQYDLAGLGAGRCPECGRLFDPADPTSFDRRRRGPQAIIGIGLALLIGATVILGFWAALMPDYGHSHHAGFVTVSGIGLVAGVTAAVLAARNRSWLGRVPLLLVAIFCVWLGLFLGSEKYFRVWQSMPDSPDEAYADTAPLGALLLGWLPGSIVVAVSFVASSVIVVILRGREGRKHVEALATPDRRPSTMKWILSFVCILIAGFCLFGFLATFEPGVKHALTYRLIYGAAVLGCLAAVIKVVIRASEALRGPDEP